MDAAVWGAFSADEIGAVIAGRPVIVRPRQLVLAPGAYERAVPIPNWTLPGVTTTGALQTLARAYRVAPGRRVLVAGNGPLNLQVAVELLEGGAELAGVVEAASFPTDPAGWARLAVAAPDLRFDGLSYLARLRRAGTRILWGTTVIGALGNGRFDRAQLSDGRIIAADALALGYGFVPSTELSRMLGCRHRWVDRHVGYLTPECDRNGETSIPGVFVVGDGAELGGARAALARGTLAGLQAADNLGLVVDRSERDVACAALVRAESFQAALWRLFQVPPLRIADIPDEAIICRCEEIDAGTLRALVTAGAGSVGALKRQSRAGMGRCQGRYCAALLAPLASGPLDERALFAPRPPAKPVPARALCFEKPEWAGHCEGDPPLAPARRATVSPPESSIDVAVIGGGILGSCTALFLAREGLDTVVLERDELNLQASGANAGSLHVQLLSFDFGAKAQAGGGPAAETLRLGPEAVRLWQALERELGEDLEIRLTGGLMLAESEEQLHFLEAKLALERRYGIEAEIVGVSDLRPCSVRTGDRCRALPDGGQDQSAARDLRCRAFGHHARRARPARRRGRRDRDSRQRRFRPAHDHGRGALPARGQCGRPVVAADRRDGRTQPARARRGAADDRDRVGTPAS
jgi:D-hydroxyproline dehydrogenase subunit alpha